MRHILLSLVLVCAAASAQSPGDVIITEIMFDTSIGGSPGDSFGEYVEILNVSQNPINIGNWFLRDEDGPAGDVLDLTGTGGPATFGIPAGTMIQPCEAVVLHCGCNTTSDFQAAWGTAFQVFAMDRWDFVSGDPFPRMNNLSNSPSATNEILTLVDSSNVVIDTANFEEGNNGWPSMAIGSSIFLLPTALDATSNDTGSNWAVSTPGTLAATTSASTGNIGNDNGSPGVVAKSLNPYPGPSDLKIDVFINGAQSVSVTGQHTLALPGDVLRLDTFSPMGAFTGTGVLFIGQFFATGTPLSFFPGFQLPFDPANTVPFVVYDGLALDPFFTPVLPQSNSGIVPVQFFGQGLSVLFTILNFDNTAPGFLGFSDSEEVILS